MQINIKPNDLSIPLLIERFAEKGGVADLALKAGVVSVQGLMLERITEKGLDANGAQIGKYSTKPIYVNPETAPRKFATVGKHGENVFRFGIKKSQKHKTGYFAGGYDEFKTVIGRNIGSVNLFLTGLMRDEFVLIETQEGWGLGWLNNEITVRALALEIKYGKQIFSAITESERQELIDIIKFEISRNAVS